MAKAAKEIIQCVRCGKPATFWNGYVFWGKRRVTAGWCSDRCNADPGFCGHYQPWMSGETTHQGNRYWAW